MGLSHIDARCFPLRFVGLVRSRVTSALGIVWHGTRHEGGFRPPNHREVTMKARNASVPDTMLRIVAVAGTLALLPGIAFGTLASDSPSDDGAVPDASAPAAIALAPCVPAGSLAAAIQLPPGEPDVPMCPGEDGYLEPCTPEQLYDMCIQEAKHAFDECMEGAGFWERQGCRVERGRRGLKCAFEFLEDIVMPFNA